MADPENGFEGLELDVALAHVPEAERLPALKACKAWIKATPAARRPLVSKFSKVASETAIKALHATLGGSLGADVGKRAPTTLEAVSPLLLMRPVSRGETLDLYAGGDFDLGDRVAAVGDGGSPPFGTRGYVVATHGEACEVLFDHEFVGGTDLHGVLPDKRGLLLPGAELVNLSHPPAMPLLGDAAPDRVVADKKGRVTKGGWDEKSAQKKGGGDGKVVVPKGILAMAAALLPGKAGLPAGPGGTPSMPVPGSRGFAAGAGRGRGNAAAGGLPSRAPGRPMPGAIVGPPSTAPGAPPAPDISAMLAGASLKSMLMGGGGGAAAAAAPAAPAVQGAVSLADLEQRMSGAAVSAPAAPGPDDPAAFWTMLAGGSPAAPKHPAPQVTPKAPKAAAGAKAVPRPKGAAPAAAAPVSLEQLEAAAGATRPVVSTQATFREKQRDPPPGSSPAPISLEELESLTASSAPSASDEDPLAFWAELQKQHRAEADRITGTGAAEKKNRRARGKKD